MIMIRVTTQPETLVPAFFEADMHTIFMMTATMLWDPLMIWMNPETTIGLMLWEPSRKGGRLGFQSVATTNQALGSPLRLEPTGAVAGAVFAGAANLGYPRRL